MKIHIANDSKQSIGGGWTFIDNLTKGLKSRNIEVTDFNNADLVLFPSTSMITKETFQAVKASSKKLIVRLDNVPRNSRNRNTGTSRLKQFAQEADGVIWQCNWARDYLRSFVQNKRAETIIYNGVDQSTYNTKKRSSEKTAIYLYSRFNRDETKRWEEAWYNYQLIQRHRPEAQLYILGSFSNEQIEYNFDFFRGERIKYFGIITDKEKMSEIYQQADYFLATYYNECFSNTYLEALSCGVELLNPNLSGGTAEMLQLHRERGSDYFSLNRMTFDYINFFEEVLNG